MIFSRAKKRYECLVERMKKSPHSTGMYTSEERHVMFAICLPLVMTSKCAAYTSERRSFGKYTRALHLEAFDCNIRSSIKVAICTVD